MKSFLAKNLVLAAICLSTTATIYSMDFRGSDSDNEDCMHSRDVQKKARYERRHHEERCDPRVNVDIRMYKDGSVDYTWKDAIETLKLKVNLSDHKNPQMLNVSVCLLPGSVDEGTTPHDMIMDTVAYIKKLSNEITLKDTNCDKRRGRR